MTETYLPRLADSELADRLGAMGAVSIEGPKACGKTATARQCSSSHVLLDLDANALATAALDPRLILRGRVPRLLDEWQRAPLVWDAVRRAVDDRASTGQFILTGSATPADDVVRHSGAGRISLMRMRPLSLFEQRHSLGDISLAALRDGIQSHHTKSELTFDDYLERIIFGGWPQLTDATMKTAQIFIRDYLSVIVDHDINEISGARRDPRLVRRFLHAYAQLTAHPAQMTTILSRAQGENNDGPSRWSAEPYFRALQRMMILDDVEAWSPHLRSRTRLLGRPKRHLVDPSLAAGIMKCTPARLRADLTTLGFLFESLATRDLRIYTEFLGGDVFHYREHSAALEVDLIAEWPDGRWIGVEVKLGGAEIDAAAATLLKLASARIATPPAALMVLTGTEYGYRRADGVWVVPLGSLGP
jgi:uncharacterized protein